jgi:hypothetical protein
MTSLSSTSFERHSDCSEQNKGRKVSPEKKSEGNEGRTLNILQMFLKLVAKSNSTGVMLYLLN